MDRVGTDRLRRTSLGMITGRLASMGLGFLFWLLAARSFSPDVVGITAGTVSAMMLCTQVANMGAGPALVTALPRLRDPSPVVGASFVVSIAAALVGGTVFLGLSAVAVPDLRAASSSLLYASLFVAVCVLGTANTVLDHLSVAVDRGHEVLVRNVAFGAVTLAGIPVAMRMASGVDAHSASAALFAPWLAAGAAACGLGAYHVRRAVPTLAFRRRIAVGELTRLLRRGVANHLLTLAERGPALLLPVVIAASAGASAAAHWYAVWMIAWGVQVIPVSVGIALLAEAARGPDQTSAPINVAVSWSLTIGSVAAVLLTLVADPVLELLGHSYRVAGVEPLRVLVWTVVPATALQAYAVTCRALGRFTEGTLAIAATGLAAVVGAGVMARSSLTGAAWAWLSVQVVAASLAWWRLSALGRAPSPSVVLEPAPA